MNINEDIIKNVINVDTSINNKSRVNFIKGKNLLDVSNQSTRADNGVTLTANGDGTFTLNGTATANTSFGISSGITLKAGTYTASGVSGGSSSTYYYGILQNNSWVFRNYNGSDTFTVSSNTTYSTILIVVGNGTTVSNVTISPMIQKGSSASTYEPYAAPSIVVDGEEIYSVPKVLWTNPSPSSTFAGQNITLSSDDYNHFEIIYSVSNYTDYDYRKSSGIIPFETGKKVQIDGIDLVDRGFVGLRRIITETSKTSFTISSNILMKSSSFSDNNIYIIPLKIIGYKY